MAAGRCGTKQSGNEDSENRAFHESLLCVPLCLVRANQRGHNSQLERGEENSLHGWRYPVVGAWFLAGKRSEPSRGTRTRNSSGRSEEHTSELQSHLNLVCRLLLEKKK